MKNESDMFSNPFEKAGEMFSRVLDDISAREKVGSGDECDVISNYSLDGLNVKSNVALDRLVRAARRFRDGSARPDVDAPRFAILLSGAPGSGKTEFVKYLAKELGAPLVSKKVSDIMSKWVGGSEKNIAGAFDEAGKKNAILFLDEIDSLLQKRENATQSWEVQQVNELLKQMEEFSGILVGATNFNDNLDRAVIRRFTFKIQLDYLTNEGKHKFFVRFFKEPLSVSDAARLDEIDYLTPGDFRTVFERLYYLGESDTNAERLAALEEESKAKNIRTMGRLGF